MRRLVVRDVSTQPYRLPLRRAFWFGGEVVTHREGVLVRVQIDGEVGFGEAAPLPGFTVGSLDDVKEDVARFASELRGLHVERNHATLAASLDWFEMRWAPTRSAFSTAIADALARQAKLPLHVWLGGKPKDAIRVNATLGGGESPASELSSAVVKMKIGVGDWADELERVRRVARRSDVERVRLDANGAWTATEAAERLKDLEGLDIDYVEQPVPREEIDALIELAAHAPVAVAADEALVDVEGRDRLVGTGAVPVLILKPAALGGPDVAVRLGRRASSAGQRVVVTTLLDGAVGRAMATHVAATLAPTGTHGLATGALLADDLADGLPVAHGAVHLAGAGLGVEPQVFAS